MTTWTLARRTDRMNPSVIREILKLTDKPGLISFAGGLPSPQTFPIDAFAQASERVLRTDGHAALQYAASEGFAPLARAGRGQPALGRGPGPGAHHHRQPAGPGPGGQGADRHGQPRAGGDAHLPRRPAGLRAHGAARWSACTATPKGWTWPICGPRPASGEQAARFLYVLPNFQNPTGRRMSEARRAELVAQAAALGLPIVEDNPYGDLWFDAPPPAPLTARNPEGCIYLGSFSKVLAPGLRLGYLVAPNGRSTPSCCRPSRPPTCTAPATTSAWWPRC